MTVASEMECILTPAEDQPSAPALGGASMRYSLTRSRTWSWLKFEMKAGGRKSPDAPNTIQAFIALECAVLPRDHDRVVAKVSCEMALDYVVADVAAFEQLTEEDCVDFASLNGLYNAWPYLREYCQSMSLRMLLPAPIILPSLPPSMKNAKDMPKQG